MRMLVFHSAATIPTVAAAASTMKASAPATALAGRNHESRTLRPPPIANGSVLPDDRAQEIPTWIV
jgi:hypothetical protein